jgi:hypothetical protein
MRWEDVAKITNLFFWVQHTQHREQKEIQTDFDAGSVSHHIHQALKD